jgi:hypothetical protein
VGACAGREGGGAGGCGLQVYEVPEEEIKKLYGGGDWHMAYICLYQRCPVVIGTDSTRY